MSVEHVATVVIPIEFDISLDLSTGIGMISCQLIHLSESFREAWLKDLLGVAEEMLNDKSSWCVVKIKVAGEES